jgi:Protein of unknown function (DUF1559)/Domain of unknown function (DUF4190)
MLNDQDDACDSPQTEPLEENGSASVSLSLGLVSALLCFLTGLPAVLFGVIALIQIRRSPGRYTGRSKAVVGLVSGLMFSIIGFVVLPFWINRTREAAVRVTDAGQLCQMATAIRNYHDAQGYLPGSLPLLDQDGKPLGPAGKPQLSWRVEILPFIGEDSLYKQFNLAEPWDSPTNKRLIPLMPKMYAHRKADPNWTRAGMTVYRVFTGPHCAFRPGNDKPMHLLDITDGLSNTIMIAESADPVIWTKPDEMEYDLNKPIPKLGEYFRGQYQFVTFDGSYHTVPASISEKKLRSSIMIDDEGFGGSEW